MDNKLFSKIREKQLQKKLDKALIYTINGKKVNRKQFESYVLNRIRENKGSDRK